MGVSSSDPHSSPAHFLQAQFQTHSNNTLSRMQLAVNQGKELSQFRQRLSSEECMYVLTTLIQQYFLLIGNKVEVCISDKLCKVNHKGKVFVFNQTARQMSAEHVDNYVKAIAKILELVSNLFKGKGLLWTSENGQLKQSLLNIVYQHHQNQQTLNREIIHTVEEHKRDYHIPQNLQSAMIRGKNTKKTNQVRQHHRYHSANLHPSFANLQIQSSVSISQFKQNNAHHNGNQVKSTFNPAFSHQITHSQMNLCEEVSPDCSYCYSQSQASKPKSTFRVMPHKQNHQRSGILTVNEKKKNNSKRFFVSAQFAISIVAQDPPQQISQRSFKKPCLRNKKHQLTISLPSDSTPSLSLILHKNQTQKKFNTATRRKSSKPQHIREKSSALESMARFVEVKQFNSSKSLIV